MKEEIFRQFKQELEERKTEIALHNAKIEAARVLENDSKVKKYLELCGVKSAIKSSKLVFDRDGEFFRFIERMNLDDTNGLYVYCGTFNSESSVYFLERDSENAVCREYRDIEKPSSIKIPIEKCEEFEKNNKVLDTTIYDATEGFLDIALKTSQQEAVNELCKRYRIK